MTASDHLQYAQVVDLESVLDRNGAQALVLYCNRRQYGVTGLSDSAAQPRMVLDDVFPVDPLTLLLFGRSLRPLLVTEDELIELAAGYDRSAREERDRIWPSNRRRRSDSVAKSVIAFDGMPYLSMQFGDEAAARRALALRDAIVRTVDCALAATGLPSSEIAELLQSVVACLRDRREQDSTALRCK